MGMMIHRHKTLETQQVIKKPVVEEPKVVTDEKPKKVINTNKVKK